MARSAGAAPYALPNACAWHTSAGICRAHGAVAGPVVAFVADDAGFDLENARNDGATAEQLIGALVEQAGPGASRSGADRGRR
jgi:hypothetical protein